MKFQGILENINARQKVVHPCYKDMEEIDFEVLLTDNYYRNLNSIHFCFPMKIKRATNEVNDVDGDLMIFNNFFPHLIKEIGITKYGSNKELIPTFSPYEIYQYSKSMMKHFPKDSLKRLEKTMFIAAHVLILTKHQ